MSGDNCNRKCEECDKEFTPQESGWNSKNWKTTCKKCRGFMKDVCNYCSKKFIQKKDDYYFYNNITKHKCNDCKVTHEELMNGIIDNDKIHNGVLIKIVYKVYIYTNRGDEENEEINYYPLVKNIKNKHHNNGVITDHKILVLYEKDTKIWHDCDYYPISTYYEIIEAEIVNNDDDDDGNNNCIDLE